VYASTNARLPQQRLDSAPTCSEPPRAVAGFVGALGAPYVLAREEIAQLATKAELEIWGGALLARIESGEQRLLKHIDSSEQRLLVEVARHIRASQEEMSRQLSVIDEKYADLPSRMSRLEAKVFGPE
jgi:hypothetical protein